MLVPRTVLSGLIEYAHLVFLAECHNKPLIRAVGFVFLFNYTRVFSCAFKFCCLFVSFNFLQLSVFEQAVFSTYPLVSTL